MRISDWCSDVCSSVLANVRSYRGPLIQGGGFAWFQNSGVGIALPESLAQETAKVRDWIAADTGRRRPWLCGFSNGAAMAANLLIETPEAYAGLIMIGGCFAVEDDALRSEEHTSELQSLMRNSYAVFCLKKKKIHLTHLL